MNNIMPAKGMEYIAGKASVKSQSSVICGIINLIVYNRNSETISIFWIMQHDLEFSLFIFCVGHFVDPHFSIFCWGNECGTCHSCHRRSPKPIDKSLRTQIESVAEIQTKDGIRKKESGKAEESVKEQHPTCTRKTCTSTKEDSRPRFKSKEDDNNNSFETDLLAENEDQVKSRPIFKGSSFNKRAPTSSNSSCYSGSAAQFLDLTPKTWAHAPQVHSVNNELRLRTASNLKDDALLSSSPNKSGVKKSSATNRTPRFEICDSDFNGVSSPKEPVHRKHRTPRKKQAKNSTSRRRNFHADPQPTHKNKDRLPPDKPTRPKVTLLSAGSSAPY
jgi:hypothetical protein